MTLRFADCTEPFETMKDAAPFIDHPAPGEVIWGNEAVLTCRAWNWRQGVRTRLTEDTTQAYFLFDGLSRSAPEFLVQAADALEA